MSVGQSDASSFAANNNNRTRLENYNSSSFCLGCISVLFVSWSWGLGAAHSVAEVADMVCYLLVCEMCVQYTFMILVSFHFIVKPGHISEYYHSDSEDCAPREYNQIL